MSRLEEYQKFIEKVVDADNYEGFYREATVEQVLDYVDKIMEEVDNMETYNDTRVTMFEFSGEGVSAFTMEEFIKVGGLKKLEGEIYYNEQSATVFVLGRVQQIGDNLFTTPEGRKFSVDADSELPTTLVDDKG